jgi:predicted RNA-binding Zn-ribbon protein involved in translation (DUF1610 family)
LDPTGGTVVYLCPGCGMQGTLRITASGVEGGSALCPACGSEVMSRELPSGAGGDAPAGT